MVIDDEPPIRKLLEINLESNGYKVWQAATGKEGLLLRAYFLLKRLGQSDEKAFGLDKSDVETEFVPLVYQPANTTQLMRV